MSAFAVLHHGLDPTLFPMRFFPNAGVLWMTKTDIYDENETYIMVVSQLNPDLTLSTVLRGCFLGAKVKESDAQFEVGLWRTEP